MRTTHLTWRPVRMPPVCVSVALALLLAGCGKGAAPSSADPPLGTDCAVEFRPPLPGALTSMYLKGKLQAANEKWIVLTNAGDPGAGETWISRESVMLIVVGRSAKSYTGLTGH